MENEARPDELLQRFKIGETKADQEIFTKFYNGLYYYAERLTKHSQESQDIVTESFIKLFERRSSFESVQKVKAFLYTCTRNACFTWLKSKGQIVPLTEEDPLYGKPEFILSQWDWAASETELLLKIRELVETKLPKGCKQIFKMRYYEGMVQVEIAKALNVSEANVTNQLNRAIKKIKKYLPQTSVLMIMKAIFSLFIK